MPGSQIYAAAAILPIDGDIIRNGRIVVEDSHIVDIGPMPSGARADIDFGNAVIIPGFVNAHTHLEYTALRGFLEDVPFFNWIRSLTMAKGSVDQDGWLASSRLGALECIAGGITTIGDNTDAGVTAHGIAETGMRGIVFQEVFGIDPAESVESIIGSLHHKLNNLRLLESERLSIGVSPHALYTVRKELFAALRNDPEINALQWSIHIAESREESAWMMDGTGPFAEMYARRNIPWDAQWMSPTEYAQSCGALKENTLAVHCVHQNVKDIEIIRNSGASVVHCPKSNGKLAAGIAPVSLWVKNGINTALGTDSAVSNNTLDMFDEMRHAIFAQRMLTHDVTALTARDALYMATLGGAKALGLERKIGSLNVGKKADFAAVSMDGVHIAPADDPYAALVYNARPGDVVFTMCDGKPLYDHGQWTTVNKNAILSNAIEMRKNFEEKRAQL